MSSNVGKIPRKDPCPSGWRDDGTVCWRRDTSYGRGVGAVRASCRQNEERCLGLCYPKCRDGFKRSGCNVCEFEGKRRIELSERLKCGDGETLRGGLCYKR